MSDMINLLEETVDFILSNENSTKEIVFIGSERSGHSCTWEEFEKLSNIEYDNGYGGQEVAKDLIIVFSDGAKVRRSEYDGSEWWVYDTPFKMPEETKKIDSLIGGSWQNLEEINEL